MIEDKVALTRQRAELVDSLATPLSVEDRVRVQGELSVVNAKIKALNTLEAAQLKAAADRRKVAGIAEAKANSARARAKADKVLKKSDGEEHDAEEDDDPGQVEAIDAWIDGVLMRHDVEFTRSRDGKLRIVGAPKWAAVLESLVDGIHAAARGQELPALPRPQSRARNPKKL